MTQPTGPYRPQPGPWQPTITDPTGLRYDRADLDDPTPTPVPAGVDGWHVTGRGVRLKQCCSAVLVGEECDCADIRRQIRTAPVIVQRPYNLRELRRLHVTAADLERRAA